MPIVFTGSAGAETFWGTDEDDIFNGNGGADVFFGNSGDDLFHSNPGAAVKAYGGFGNDVYVANSQMTIVERADQGRDTVIALTSMNLGANLERIFLVLSATSSTGNALSNTMHGNQDLSSTLRGGDGSDTLFGGDASDSLLGEAGADRLDGGLGADVLNGGTGFDTAHYLNAKAAVRANLSAPGANLGEAAGDAYISIENITGSRFSDTLTGNSVANSISAGEGNDTVSGGLGSDRLAGGRGRDTMIGGGGDDRFVIFDKNDSGGFTIDVVKDFDDSGNDRIDFSGLIFGGALAWRGTGAFTGAHQVRIRDIAGADVLVEVNISGSLAPDMIIRLENTTASSMTSSDFIL